MIGGARRLARRLSTRLPTSPGGTTVLAYHLVGGGTDSPVDVPLTEFGHHLEVLRRDFRVVSLAHAVERPDGEAGDGRLAVALTFDDAYRNFDEQVWPRLRDAGLPATLFVPVGFLDGTSPPPLDGALLPPLAWERLRELAEAGLDVGAHSLTHPDLRRLDDEWLADELAGSRRRLEAALERPVTRFAYPRALWDRRVERAAAAAYDAALAAGGRRLRPASLRHPHRLPRVPVRRALDIPFADLLTAPVWLEEWLSDRIRRR